MMMFRSQSESKEGVPVWAFWSGDDKMRNLIPIVRRCYKLANVA